jgi:hypothetical protein
LWWAAAYFEIATKVCEESRFGVGERRRLGWPGRNCKIAAGEVENQLPDGAALLVE